MSISIPEEKITDALITAYMKHRRGPEGDLIWQEHFQELADMLIKHGIVSPPKPSMTECLVDSLEEILNYTGGADSALHDEYVVERAQNAIARAKGGAE